MSTNAFSSQISKNKVWAAGGLALTVQSANPIASGDYGIYVDSNGVWQLVYSDGTARVLSAGSLWDPVRVATDAVLPNTPTYSASALTYTAGSNVSINDTGIDGVTDLAVGDRILVKDQATGSRNGIYEVTTVGTGSVPWVITRTSDANTSGEFATGKLVAVSEGSANADSIFMLSTNAPITLDTTTLTFAAAPLSITYGAAGDMAADGIAAANAAGVSTKVSRADHVHAWTADLEASKEANHGITVQASTTATTAGGNLTLAAGAGNTTGAGGLISVTAGAGGNDAVGGAASLVGGAAGGGNRAGGAASLVGGAGAGTQAGGAIAVTGGAGGATGAGGALALAGGAGGATSGNGGAITIAGGAATNGGSNGGAVTIRGGAKNGGGTDGALTIGDSNTASIGIGAAGVTTTYSGPIAAGATSWEIADPGNGGAIPVTTSGVVNLTSAGAETRTLAIPTFNGQRLALMCDAYVGDIVVTVAAAVNQAANTILTFGAAADFCELVAVELAGSRVWRVAANDGVALS